MHEFTTASTTVADIVAHDLRAASVFARYGIDFCCGGRRSIAEACRANGTDGDAVLRELEVLSASQSIDTTGWSLTRLIDHIESKHHAYVRRQIPALEALTGKLAAVHGGQHPDMVSIASVFGALAAELERHMAKEEQLLFPHIRSLVAAHDAGTPFPPNPFGSVRNPIRMMGDRAQQRRRRHALDPQADAQLHAARARLHHLARLLRGARRVRATCTSTCISRTTYSSPRPPVSRRRGCECPQATAPQRETSGLVAARISETA
jgi:iron-sulfur cluster repair di-iron protein